MNGKNRDVLLTLADEEFYDAMLYVITKLSFAYTNSRLGVIEWLGSDYQEEGDE
jgi:hypothetical protein